MKNKCKKCGASAESEYCFQHKPRKALNKSKYKIGIDPYDEETSVSKSNIEMIYLFTKIWRKRPHKSEISGEYLGKEPLSIYFHHILPKEKYHEACLDEENIILLTLDEHTNVENDIYKYEEINKRREYLKSKYEIQ